MRFEYLKKNFEIFKIYIVIFFSFFLIRYFFIKISGFDNFELQPDSYWYSKQSDEILKGNFNLLRPLFITAPFFSYFQALVKLIFSSYWMEILEFLQVTIASIAGIFFYRLSLVLFNDKQTSILSTFLFCFYPLTLWWVGTFSQEIWFQSFLIIFFYYFFVSLEKNCLKLLIVSSIFFSLTFLTKSHILLFSPFIPVIIIFKKNINVKNKMQFIFTFVFISLISTLPYGIYNLINNKTYTISSGGLGGSFLIGNNDEAYLNHVKLNNITIEQKERFRNVNYKIFHDLKLQIKDKNPKEIQNLYFHEGLKWIKENPNLAIELKMNHAKRFFTPGISKYWHSYEKWLAALLVTSPLYLFAFASISYSLFKNFNEHFWIASLMISMFLFSIIFYYSGRFIVITLEPYYIVYASYLIIKLKNLIYVRTRDF